MKKQPIVTVITPTYNRADYIIETVASILEQGYTNLEYIVLDDGSQDDTVSLLQRYKKELTLERHPNMGEANTVNKGFSMAHGAIVGVVNSDDPLLPNAINNIVEFMIDHPEIGVVYPDWDMIDAEGKLITHVQTYDYSYINMLRWHHCMPGPGTFFRKEVVDALNGRDPQFRYVGDFDFWLRAGLITPFSRIPKTLATFRVHPTSASTSQAGQHMAEEYITLINKIYSLPNLTPEAVKIKNEAYSSAYYIAGRVCEPGNFSERRNYFKKALLYAPLKYMTEYRESRLFGFIIPNSYPFLGQILYGLKKWKAKLFSALKFLFYGEG
jgi:glycosyltransferase involved in cell wall biosynthesis